MQLINSEKMSSFFHSVSLSDSGLFYIPSIRPGQDSVLFEDREELNHLTKVLRKKEGDPLFFTNGEGIIFSAVLGKIKPGNAEILIREYQRYENPLAGQTIIIPLLKNIERVETALEKCVEFGFTEFIFCHFEHSIRTSVNLERLAKKSISSMKQSLNSHLPELSFIKSLKSLVIDNKRVLWFDREGVDNFINVNLDKSNRHFIIVGPEGGFSPLERKFLNSYGSPLKMLNSRLRAETAVISAGSLFANKILFQ